MFFALTFGWTWGLWWISSAIKPDAPMLSGAMFLATAFGPGLAAAATTWAFEGLGGLRIWFGRCLRWRVGWRWYALAAVMPPIIMLLALGIHAPLGGTIASFPKMPHLLIALAQFPLVLIFGGPRGEEFGWRGYALPALADRMGWRWASVVVGATWVLWHGLSVAMARLSVDVGYSVPPAILLHSVINWCSMLVPIMPEGGDAQAYSLVAAIAILVGLVALKKPGPESTT